MVDVKQYRKDMNYQGYDKVYESSEEFEEVLPFMGPRLEGAWNILILEPNLAFVRSCLDTGMIPSYVFLTLAVEQAQLDQLYLERPKLAAEERTPWKAYMELISKFPVPMDDKAMREIYYRCGPREDKLAEALEQLLECRYVTMTEVNKRFAPRVRVYANQVVRTFLTGRRDVAWKQLSMLENELGTSFAFYSMRKAVRKLFKSKAKWLRNETVKENYIDQVRYDDLIFLYWHFEVATSPYQLYPILKMFERRCPPYVSSFQQAAGAGAD